MLIKTDDLFSASRLFPGGILARSGTREQIHAVHNSEFPGLRSERVSAAKIWLSLWHLWQAAPEFPRGFAPGALSSLLFAAFHKMPRIRKESPVTCCCQWVVPLHCVLCPAGAAITTQLCLPPTHPHPSQTLIQGISNPLLVPVKVSRWELQRCRSWCWTWIAQEWFYHLKKPRRRHQQSQV